MTALRPEREGAPQGAQEPDPYASYEPSGPHDAYDDAYGETDAFAAAVEGLDDPLTDPLPRPSPGLVPGIVTGPAPGPVAGPTTGATPGPATGPNTGPNTRPDTRRATGPDRRPGAGAAPGPTTGPVTGAARTAAAGPVAGHTAPSVPGPAPASEGPSGGPSRARHRRAPAPPAGPADPEATAVLSPVPAAEAPEAPTVPARGSGRRRAPAADDETVALRAVQPLQGDDQTVLLRQVQAPPAPAETGGAESAGPRSGDGGGEPGAAAGPQDPPSGGRAARRRAAQAAARRGGGRGGARARGGAGGKDDSATSTAAAEAGSELRTTAAAPRTRMEAKRAARARKDSPAVVVSRLVGELFITVGVLMLLFVTYQLWWTNIRAHQQANGAANSLQKKWDRDGAGNRDPGTFSPGEGFAILYIPKLDVKAPIAEGISKLKVLDHGMVGHYNEGKLKTAMPWDKKGNFALAGHRNTHGEPFRYINNLKPGDKIVVETQSAYFTYEMTSILPQTPPSNTGVIGPVPPGSGFTKPGRYITLTTCTPEFTSKYRMIVWGKMVDERPRSKGKPDALVQ
ncbi:class E sortase [Streptomyces sp. NPDC021225]|uniref:class E sortase n=1 Tax=Streptomyces sp. NPDC021225 TaxID=3365121 RepID=UPI0037AADC7D